ncbi:hypothetical protein EDC01DRAFT_664341 [Geopyxis carbonaria]|nr:hypothetical protein EDC01DRAFT_664341 [Geopyxis carbonaria]
MFGHYITITAQLHVISFGLCVASMLARSFFVFSCRYGRFFLLFAPLTISLSKCWAWGNSGSVIVTRQKPHLTMLCSVVLGARVL